MTPRLPRLLLADEVTSEGQVRSKAGVRSAFIIDGSHALTAEHCVRRARDGHWVLRLPADPVDRSKAVCIPVKVIDLDRDLDIALLAREPDESAVSEAEATRLFQDAALALGGPLERDTKIGVAGYLYGNLPDGVAASGSVTSLAVTVGTARAMQLFVNELAAAEPDDPKGMSGSAVLTLMPHGDSVIGLVRSFSPVVDHPDRPAEWAPAPFASLGGKLFATRIDDIARRFPQVADLLARKAERDLATPGDTQVAARQLSLATLLRADAERTAFFGRQSELSTLRAWCTSDTARSARLVTGPAGQGKTRLARQLCTLMTENDNDNDWVAAVIRGSGDSVSLDLGIARAAQTGRPLLLVVDYAAEYGSGALRAVLQRLRDPTRPTPSVWRMLLLARNVGDWWSGGSVGFFSALNAADVVTPQEPLQLPGLTTAGDDREQFFWRVIDALRPDVERFAEQHGLAMTATLVVPRLDHADYGSALMIHIAAVCSLLPAAASTDGGASSRPEHMIDRFLDLERDHHWLYSTDLELSSGTRIAFRNVAEGPAGARRVEDVVAAGTLFGAPDLYRTSRLVAATLGDQAAHLDTQAVARWLHDLYPPASSSEAASYVAPLQPDLLGEELVLRVLNRQRADGIPEDELLPYAVLNDGVDETQARRLLTVLIRLTERHPQVANLISGRVHDEDGKARGVVARLPEDVDLRPVEAATPDRSANLVHAAARLCDHSLSRTRRQLGDLDPFRYRDTNVMTGQEPSPLERTLLLVHQVPAGLAAAHARNYLRYASRVIDLGYPDVAVEFAGKAYLMFRELHRDDNQYAHAMAESLATLSLSLQKFGVDDKAARYADRAEREYRRLGLSGRLSYLDLARLSELRSNVSATVGSPHDALAHAEQAVHSYRRLVHADDSQFLPHLAAALDSLVDRLCWLRRFEAADESASEALEKHRTIAGAWTARNTFGVVRALWRKGRCRSGLSDDESALDFWRDALELLESHGLDEVTYGPLAAEILIDSSTSSRAMGRHAEALASARRAAEIGERLYQFDRVAYQVLFARALGAFAACAKQESDLPSAQNTAQKSANLLRSVYRKNRVLSLLPEVARSCSLVAEIHHTVDNLDAAANHAHAAVEYWTSAVQAAPELFSGELDAAVELVRKVERRRQSVPREPTSKVRFRQRARRVVEGLRSEARIALMSPRRLRARSRRTDPTSLAESAGGRRRDRDLPWNWDDPVRDMWTPL